VLPVSGDAAILHRASCGRKGGVRPLGWRGAGCGLDRVSRVLVLELNGLQISLDRVQSAGVVDLFDEGW